MDQQLQPHYIMVQGPTPEDAEVSLVDLWYVLWRQRWFMIIIIFLFTVGALAYALLATPIYRAEVLLAPAETENQSSRLAAVASRFGGLADLAGLPGPANSNTATAIAILKSRRFLSEFIVQRNLKPILFPEQWNPEQKSWNADNPSLTSRIKAVVVQDKGKGVQEKELAPGEPSMWDAYQCFRTDVLSIGQDAETGLVTVSVNWDNPTLAAAWANALVGMLNAKLRAQAIQESQRGIEYLKEQIAQTSLADLRAILYRLIEEHTKNITLAKVNDQYALKVIDPAVVPQDPIKPRRTMIVILGFILGIVVAVFGSVVRNLWRQQMRTCATASE